MLTSSKQLQKRPFHVVERTGTSTKCQKMKNARAKRAKMLFFIVKYANLRGFCCRRRRGCLSSLLSPANCLPFDPLEVSMWLVNTLRTGSVWWWLCLLLELALSPLSLVKNFLVSEETVVLHKWESERIVWFYQTSWWRLNYQCKRLGKLTFWAKASYTLFNVRSSFTLKRIFSQEADVALILPPLSISALFWGYLKLLKLPWN